MQSSVREKSVNLVRRAIHFAARDYSAGVDVKSGLDVGSHLEGMGYKTTLGYWDKDDEDPFEVADIYRHALSGLSAQTNDGYLSMKANAFGYNLHTLSDLLAISNTLAVPIHFDSMWPESVDQTFDMVRSLHTSNSYSHIGVTLPGRWHRSLTDTNFVKELNLPVRVVKGQWEDSVQPEVEMRNGFLSLIKQLTDHGNCVRVATHDTSLARRSLQILMDAKVNCELELLYGLPVSKPLQEARQLGVKVRIYIPFGKEWVPYCLSYLKKNPRRLLWLLKDMTAKPYISRFPIYPVAR